MCKNAVTLQQEVCELRSEVRELRASVEQMMKLVVALQRTIEIQQHACQERDERAAVAVAQVSCGMECALSAGPVQKWTARDKDYDRQRGTSTKRGYGANWRKVRQRILAQQPLCEECLKHGIVTVATDVHHIHAKRAGGLDTESNLISLCHACHSRITRQEMLDGGGAE